MLWGAGQDQAQKMLSHIHPVDQVLPLVGLKVVAGLEVQQEVRRNLLLAVALVQLLSPTGQLLQKHHQEAQDPFQGKRRKTQQMVRSCYNALRKDYHDY